ncbi:Golgi matrix protein [Pleurostoma richardsiae]|uniref:Golgi matrix protein n=1 Tax=Pleurostoma richardsiae TaxID=41990 RepID=A0AA38RBA7_9PEZI|nr:Golgi matrix protein [Pleurostoma richardsiae]
MSSAAPTEPTLSAPQGPKKKNNKKKKKAAKAETPVITTDKDGGQRENDEQSGDEPETPVNPTRESDQPESPTKSEPEPRANGHATMPTSNGHPAPSLPPPATEPSPDTSAKLEAMTQEREALRAEVEQLRRQLETIQETHSSEVTRLRSDLEDSEAAKEHAETQYQTLLGRVEKIKETLGDRLKRDKAELEEAKDRIEELEGQNEGLQQGARAAEEDAERLREELQEAQRELAGLRSRSNLSQQNWLKEKEEMARQVQHFRSELESTSGAMGEWEVIAMEERSIRESLTDKVGDLEEQLLTTREAYERAAAERDAQTQTIDGLQRALQEIQEARRRELREMVESSEEQIQEMKKRVKEADARVAEAEAAKEALSKELERTAPFEKEVKEKNLLIGKLRHEAIVLNDHLTKALRYLKKTKPEEQVDRQIVTNYLLQFLALDRSDPKKFQILQVIAGYLNWTEEQKEQAGLARPGTSSHTLRLPLSPFHRTPSTPSLNTEFFQEPTSTTSKESLADLWAGFLERSVEEASGEHSSRKDSVSSMGTTGTTKPDAKG